MDAFDADVLIHAVNLESDVGEPVRRRLRAGPDPIGIGSVILWPELLSKPLRQGADHEADELADLLGRVELLPLDDATARLAATLGAQHDLRAADAVHLATAIAAGADRFITNNRRDFPKSIIDIEITYPEDL